MQDINENATLVERIHSYVQDNQHEKAKALAKLGDYLEECFSWEITWGDPSIL